MSSPLTYSRRSGPPLYQPQTEDGRRLWYDYTYVPNGEYPRRVWDLLKREKYRAALYHSRGRAERKAAREERRSRRRGTL